MCFISFRNSSKIKLVEDKRYMIIWYIIRTCKKFVSRKLYDVIDQNSGKRRDKPSWASILVFSEKKPSVIKWILGKKLLLRINRSPKKWNFPLLPILVDEFVGCSFEISFFFSPVTGTDVKTWFQTNSRRTRQRE